ncbi:DEAD/DEAH box helicase [Paenibacillus sp. XY044]|uniref:DEAD/DEAH box helicase n=1 Tax=Paenibacillus sp. XY044 TaxID=2026089 RepID=UPI00211AB629|nr:DEAD/DEAH box helicase [Paenibacillus sp. XY044]
MIPYTDTITIHTRLSGYGDALIYGSTPTRRSVPGIDLKHRLFAWHEDTLYGTQLDVQQVQEIELVILPAEYVIPFFGRLNLLAHIQWAGDEGTETLIRLAPALMSCVREKRYSPSLSAFQSGKLLWNWDEARLDADAREEIRDLGPEFAEGLRAAFSSMVFSECYGTEATASDLRREYPMLFAREGAVAGLTEQAWLISIGWKADTAPFRPVLQLLEPDEAEPVWRLQLVLQDKLDPSVLVPVRLDADGQAYGVWPDVWTAHIQERSAGWAEHLRASLPASVRAAERSDVLGQPLSDAAAWQFLTADSRRLLDAGWQVLLPAWWEGASRRKPKLRAKVKAGEGEEAAAKGQGSSLFGLDSIIQFDWRVSIGDLQITEDEFKELVARNERLVRFRGEWITLDPVLIKQIGQMMEGVDSSQGLSLQDVLHLHLQRKDEDAGARKREDGEEEEAEEAPDEEARIELEVELNEHLLTLMNQLSQKSAWPKLDVPSGLQAELRSYQYDGFSWLAFLRRFGLGACLADDMGLGKTIQFITYLLHLKERADANGERHLPSLLICPTSVLGNWQKEISRFAPSLKVLLHYGSRRSGEEALREELREADVVLTSYATATLDQELLKEFTWESLCLDEAQNIKNAQTKQSAAVRSFPARHRIALTGTPIENRLSELWSLYDFMNPGFLGSLRSFQVRFIQPIERDQDEQRTEQLQKLVKPFMLRRKKKDPHIQLELPEKNEMKTYIHLTAEQSAIYDQTVNDLMNRVQKLEGIQRKGAILSALTQLKQICDHPVLLTGESVENFVDPGDIPAASGMAGEPGGAGDAVDSGILSHSTASGVSGDLETAGKHEAESNEAAISDAGAPADEHDSAADTAGGTLDTERLISRSAKLERLLAMVKELREEGDRCLIFTQYIGMGQMLQRVLGQELQEKVLYLNGSTSKTARDRMIDQFQSQSLPAAEQPNVFILSIKAGGVGLNLTAANHVFHFDRWWNPAVENQATDRAYRMGQTKDVQVHKFISLGTLEERIDEMLESKQQLSDNVISSTESWITELSTDALKDLFTLRRDW